MTIVKQFHATVEYDFDREDKVDDRERQYIASFMEFFTANMLNYNFYADSISIDNEDPLVENQIA